MRGFVGARFTKVAVGSFVRPKYTRGKRRHGLAHAGWVVGKEESSYEWVLSPPLCEASVPGGSSLAVLSCAFCWGCLSPPWLARRADIGMASRPHPG